MGLTCEWSSYTVHIYIPTFYNHLLLSSYLESLMLWDPVVARKWEEKKALRLCTVCMGHKRRYTHSAELKHLMSLCTEARDFWAMCLGEPYLQLSNLCSWEFSVSDIRQISVVNMGRKIIDKQEECYSPEVEQHNRKCTYEIVSVWHWWDSQHFCSEDEFHFHLSG